MTNWAKGLCDALEMGMVGGLGGKEEAMGRGSLGVGSSITDLEDTAKDGPSPDAGDTEGGSVGGLTGPYVGRQKGGVGSGIQSNRGGRSMRRVRTNGPRARLRGQGMRPSGRNNSGMGLSCNE